MQQMRHITKEAAREIAWLGPATHDSSMLLAHIHIMVEALWTENMDIIAHAYRQPERVKSISAAFRSWCSQGYWKRLRVMQEFAVANKLYIAWGDCMIEDICVLSWVGFFSKQIYKLSRLPNQAAEELRATFVQVCFPPEESFLQKKTTRRARHQRGSRTKDSLWQLLVTSLVLEGNENYPLTTEPKDRIFALLHLAHDAEQFDAIMGYSLTCKETYQKAATVMLHQGHIDLLSCCQFPFSLVRKYPILSGPGMMTPVRIH